MKNNKLFEQVIENFTSPIHSFLDDPLVTEIMINAYNDIWIEKEGRSFKTDSTFDSEDALMSAVNSISQFVNRPICKEVPHMAARLPEGHRVQVIIPPCSRKGITVAIRKFSKKNFTIEQLLEKKTISTNAIEFLKNCIQLKKNLIVSGGTSSGKTTLLNIISQFISEFDRLVVIEDNSELRTETPNSVLLEAKTADLKGKGGVSIRQLLACSLRLNPDWIVIGEVRAQEALDLLQALNTGHSGFGTIHSNSAIDSLSRLETLSLYSNVNLPLQAIRSQVASAINIIVHVSKMSDGSRKVTQISEILALNQNGEYQINDIFKFNFVRREADGSIVGSLEATGNKPTFYNELEIFGLKNDKLFDRQS